MKELFDPERRSPEGCTGDTEVENYGCGDCRSCSNRTTKEEKPPVSQMLPIEDVLAYRFPALVKRIATELNLSMEEADELFRATLQFLYLAGTGKKPVSPPKMIDECWHTFIIFTHEYRDFCDRHFGHFIHHVPFTDENRAVMVAKVTEPARNIAERIFGKLSRFWVGNAEDCDSCAPSKDCNSQ